MPNFTKIPQEFRESYKEKFNLKGLSNEEIKKKAEDDPVIFGYAYIGKKVRLHQAYIMHKFVQAMSRGRIRLALCLARQLGKTIGACILLIWLCWYNKMPATIANVTIWYVVSRDDDTAKELLGKIRMLLYEGDIHMLQYEIESFFTGSIKEPNNTEQITFLNNCFIKSVPPTKKILGKSGNLWIDEAHRLNCTDISTEDFFDLASAITAETKGAIVLSSSPEGIVGFFHRAIDPDGQYEDNEYDSIWWDHTIWDDDSEECKNYKAHVEKERIRLTAAGRYKMFQQEHGALFTVTEIAFFDHEDIDNNLEDVPNLYEYTDTPCSLGIDYGRKDARTVLTIRTRLKDFKTKEDTIRQIFQWRSPADFDIPQLKNPEFEHSIQRLKRRYNLFKVISDDCANGDDINRFLKTVSGFEFNMYNFRSDQMTKFEGINRNCVAYSYRTTLKSSLLKIPKWNKIQQFEMKTVQEVVQKILISIKSPQGQLCDTFDSDMMASLPFLDMQNIRDFQVDSLHGDDEEPDNRSPRVDKSSFKKMTDEQCRQLIADANEGLIGPED